MKLSRLVAAGLVGMSLTANAEVDIPTEIINEHDTFFAYANGTHISQAAVDRTVEWLKPVLSIIAEEENLEKKEVHEIVGSYKKLMTALRSELSQQFVATGNISEEEVTMFWELKEPNVDHAYRYLSAVIDAMALLESKGSVEEASEEAEEMKSEMEEELELEHFQDNWFVVITENSAIPTGEGSAEQTATYESCLTDDTVFYTHMKLDDDSIMGINFMLMMMLSDQPDLANELSGVLSSIESFSYRIQGAECPEHQITFYMETEEQATANQLSLNTAWEEGLQNFVAIMVDSAAEEGMILDEVALHELLSTVSFTQIDNALQITQDMGFIEEVSALYIDAYNSINE